MSKLITLNGVLEAAVNHCMQDEKWLEDMANDDGGGEFTLPNTKAEVYQELEEFVTDVLADNTGRYSSTVETPYEASGHVPVASVDNRDEHTTWLWINDTQYVEVDPAELMDNMRDNCFPDTERK